FFSSRRRHTRSKRDWSSDVCSSDLFAHRHAAQRNHTVNMAVNRHDFVSLIQAGNQELIAGFLGGVALEVTLVAGIADIHREKTSCRRGAAAPLVYKHYKRIEPRKESVYKHKVTNAILCGLSEMTKPRAVPARGWGNMRLMVTSVPSAVPRRRGKTGRRPRSRADRPQIRGSCRAPAP